MTYLFSVDSPTRSENVVLPDFCETEEQLPRGIEMRRCPVCPTRFRIRISKPKRTCSHACTIILLKQEVNQMIEAQTEGEQIAGRMKEAAAKSSESNE